MRKVRLTEADLNRLVRKVINENQGGLKPCDPKTFGVMLNLIRGGDEFKMQNIEGDGNLMVFEIPNLHSPCIANRKSVFK
jgi:hypothetical protein